MAIEITDGGICIACGIVDMRDTDFDGDIPIKALGVLSARGVNLDPDDTNALGVELTLDRFTNYQDFVGFISSDISGSGGIYLADPANVSQPPLDNEQSNKVILSDMSEGDGTKGVFRFMIFKVEMPATRLTGI